MGDIDTHYQNHHGKDPLFKGLIKLDDLKMTIKPERYDFTTWIALVGGLLKSVTGICGLLVKTWVYTDYMNTVIGSLFMVKKKGKDEKDDNVPVKIGKKLEWLNKTKKKVKYSRDDLEQKMKLRFCT